MLTGHQQKDGRLKVRNIRKVFTVVITTVCDKPLEGFSFKEDFNSGFI